MKQIIVTVSPDGSTQVETRGFEGASCREGSRFLEEALGTAKQERLTAEFHSGSQTQLENRQQN